MKAKSRLFSRLMGSLFAFTLLAAPTLATGGTLTISQIDVVVGGVHYCSDSVPTATCSNAIWFLGPGGITLNQGQTLILTQSGSVGAQPRGGENFDSSDRGGGPDPLMTCSGPPNGQNPGDPCTVQIYINTGSGLVLVNGGGGGDNGNDNPLSAGNDEPTVDAGTAVAFAFNEAVGWMPPPAGTFTGGPNFTLSLAYADNIHGHACPASAAGSPNPEDCFPQPVWCSSAGTAGTPTQACPSGTFPAAGGFFIGAGRSGIGNCIDASNPNPELPPAQGGVAHENKDASGNVVNCYDGGALRITANPPNLTITKSPKNGTFTVGSSVSYTIVVGNNAGNGSVAHNVQLTDALPGNGGLVWTTAMTTQGTCVNPIAGNSLSCSLGDIADGGSVTVTVTAPSPTPPAACQDQPNGTANSGGAIATDNEGQTVRDNGDQTCTLHPHLKVVKSPKAGTFTFLGAVSFTIVVSNDGDPTSVATNVALSDQLPTNGGLNWSGATITASQGQATCSISASSLLTCTNLGSIAAGAANAVTVTVSLASTPAAACQSQPNPAANATADGGLMATDNGSQSCVPPQLKVVKSPKGGTFTQGSQVSFTIVVSNPAAAGASSATNVALNDTLPTNGGLTWQTVATTQGSCTLSGANNSSLSCALGTIAPGGSVTITVTSTNPTPAAACTSQPNPAANATADGGLMATDNGSLTCTPPPQGGLIAPTGTTCQQFASGTAPTLGEVDYSVSGGKIAQNVTPGVFFYYAKITVPDNTTVTVGESQNDTAALFQIQQNQAYLFTADCTKSATGTLNAAGTGASFTVATGGTYIVSVKYSTKSIAGTAAPTSDPVTYTFTTTPPGASSSGSVLLKKQ
jgi:uncharacterized repeat protein (TIGR01451 family)